MPNTVNARFGLSAKYHGLEDNIWASLSFGGEKIVNLGQGYPDYNPAPHVVKNLALVSQPDATYLNHQYARVFGHVRLVKVLAALYGKLLSREIDPMNEVIVTGGAYGALFYTIMSNIGPGDEVIIIEPAFDCYKDMIQLAGGTPVYIPLLPSEDFKESPSSASWKLDMEKLAKTFNAKTKAIILNSPNNPIGKVFSRQELIEIGNLCKKFNSIIISDEVYEWIVYDGHEHVRIAGLENFWDRTITICSAGKTFSLTGWKLGWAYGPAHLMYNLRIAHQNCLSECQTPEQEAIAMTLEAEIPLLGTPQSFFYKMVQELTKKRQRMVKALRQIGTIPIVPEGGYLMLVNWTPLADKIDLSKETPKEDDFKLAKWLHREKKLVGIPPSAFYSEANKHLAKGYIRFNFYKKEETLAEAEEIFKTFL